MVFKDQSISEDKSSVGEDAGKALVSYPPKKYVGVHADLEIGLGATGPSVHYQEKSGSAIEIDAAPGKVDVRTLGGIMHVMKYTDGGVTAIYDGDGMPDQLLIIPVRGDKPAFISKYGGSRDTGHVTTSSFNQHVVFGTDGVAAIMLAGEKNESIINNKGYEAFYKREPGSSALKLSYGPNGISQSLLDGIGGCPAEITSQQAQDFASSLMDLHTRGPVKLLKSA